MSYTNLHGDILENEHDEYMTRKYGDKYKYVKYLYPDVYKLPEEEIQPLTHIIRYKGDTMEEAEKYLMDHIKQNEPLWKQKYFSDNNQNQNTFSIKNSTINQYQKPTNTKLTNHIYDGIQKIHNYTNSLGEFVADGIIAKNYKDQMDKTANVLVKKFGSGGGNDIDNYYHALLQCQLAKISPESKRNGLWLGDRKEDYDYFKKHYFEGKPKDEVLADQYKDLNNNIEGSNLGTNNPNKSCYELIEHKRTPNMRKMNLW